MASKPGDLYIHEKKNPLLGNLCGFFNLSLNNAHCYLKKILYARNWERRSNRKERFFFFLLKLLDKRHRSRIDVLSTNKVKPNGKNYRGTINEDIPVHRR